MNNLSKTNNNWIPLQANAFSRWISEEVNHSSHPIDITKDLSDGTTLIELAQILTHKKIEQNWSRKPKSIIEKTQNCDLAIDLLKKNGVKIVGISGKDICDNNEKLILGLIWSLISHYSIGKSVEDTNEIKDKDNNSIINSPHTHINIQKDISQNEQKTALMKWANSKTKYYPYIHNFKPYELSMCALLDSYFPDKIKYKNLNPENRLDNSELAVDVMIELGIPVFVYSDDLKKNNYLVDDKTLLTQLSSVKSTIDRANISSGLEIIDHEDEEKQSESDSESEELEINDNEKSEESEEREDEVENKKSSEIDLVSEPIEEMNDDEIADDEEIQNETTESYQSTSNNAENSKFGFTIDYNDESHPNHKHSKKRIRIRIKSGKDKDGFQINEEEEIQSFMKKYLCISNIGKNGEGNINKNVKVRVKYHGKIVEKTIRTPFHNINVHLHHHSHHHHQENSEYDTENEYESNQNDYDENDNIAEEEFEEENNEYDEEDQNNNHDEDTQNNDSEYKSEIDLEKRAEMEDEIEAEIENEYEAENDEQEMLGPLNKDQSKDVPQIQKNVQPPLNENNKSPKKHENEGKKFGLVITLKGSDYNNGGRVEENINQDGPIVKLALTLVHCEEQFLNSAGLKLDLTEADIQNNINQQFVFGQKDNYTVIESEYKHGMVWDVANANETNPPSGTPFYLYPFHGRHNQHFIYKNEMIYALQNNQVVTYVGGYTPLVMMPPREDLKSRQTFHVSLL